MTRPNRRLVFEAHRFELSAAVKGLMLVKPAAIGDHEKHVSSRRVLFFESPSIGPESIRASTAAVF